MSDQVKKIFVKSKGPADDNKGNGPVKSGTAKPVRAKDSYPGKGNRPPATYATKSPDVDPKSQPTNTYGTSGGSRRRNQRSNNAQKSSSSHNQQSSQQGQQSDPQVRQDVSSPQQSSSQVRQDVPASQQSTPSGQNFNAAQSYYASPQMAANQSTYYPGVYPQGYSGQSMMPYQQGYQYPYGMPQQQSYQQYGMPMPYQGNQYVAPPQSFYGPQHPVSPFASQQKPNIVVSPDEKDSGEQIPAKVSKSGEQIPTKVLKGGSDRKINPTHGPYHYVGQLPSDPKVSVFVKKLVEVKFFANCVLCRTASGYMFQLVDNILQFLLSSQAAHTFTLRIDGQEGLRLFQLVMSGNKIWALTAFFKQCYELTLIGTFDTEHLEELNKILSRVTFLCIQNLSLTPHDCNNCFCLKGFLETIPGEVSELIIDFTRTSFGLQKPLRWILGLNEHNTTTIPGRKFDYLELSVKFGTNMNDLNYITDIISKCLKKDGIGIILVSEPHTKFFGYIKDESRNQGSGWSADKPVVHPSLYNDQSTAWFTCFSRRLTGPNYQRNVIVRVLCRMLANRATFEVDFRNYDHYKGCWNFEEMHKSLDDGKQ